MPNMKRVVFGSGGGLAQSIDRVEIPCRNATVPAVFADIVRPASRDIAVLDIGKLRDIGNVRRTRIKDDPRSLAKAQSRRIRL